MKLIDNMRLSFRNWIDCTFKSTKILHHDGLDLLNKPKIVRSCIFPIANPYFELSVDYVPDENIGKDFEWLWIRRRNRIFLIAW
jgi:hypothetical protein